MFRECILLNLNHIKVFYRKYYNKYIFLDKIDNTGNIILKMVKLVQADIITVQSTYKNAEKYLRHQIYQTTHLFATTK